MSNIVPSELRDKVAAYNEILGALETAEQLLMNIKEGEDLTCQESVDDLEVALFTLKGVVGVHQMVLDWVKSGTPLEGVQAMLEGNMEGYKALLDVMDKELEGAADGTEAGESAPV